MTGAGEATVNGKGGRGRRSMALPTGTTTFQQHTTKGGPLDQRTEIPLVWCNQQIQQCLCPLISCLILSSLLSSPIILYPFVLPFHLLSLPHPSILRSPLSFPVIFSTFLSSSFSSSFLSSPLTHAPFISPCPASSPLLRCHILLSFPLLLSCHLSLSSSPL